ncbi:hypothetical protein ABMA28_003821 [Loxostege sticticalis]|uniref:CFAP61 dimerisation domain-containing protein n=1 Tax=Loxostege sticticalis TaxID=481309 RepID=A0ABD0ST59_LOXSC
MTRPESATQLEVTWLFSEDDFNEFRREHSIPTTTRHGLAAQLHVVHPLEDEELEFNIVKIDTDLLRVPKMLSYDTVERGLADSIMRALDDASKHDKISEEKVPKKEKLKMVSATCESEPTRFSGPPNAFLLELFAMHPGYDERYGFDMLEAAFELFPDRDYCVMCLPSNHPSFPLLEHFTLVTCFGTRMRFINETLYVAHVNSVRGDVAVRPGEASDLCSLRDVLEHTPRIEPLVELFESALNSRTLYSYVLLSQKQPIGMVILGPLEDGTAIRTQYDLDPEPRRPCTDGTVLAGVMSPALEPHGRWYMRDILRQSHCTTLFWIMRLFAKGDVSPSRNLMSFAGHMSPVQPRRSVPNISGNKDLDKIFQDMAMPFALWVLERPLTSLPKVYVNNSIVVVGASRTGLSFVEHLILGPTAAYLTFSNITLVSEHGLPTVVECLKAADTCVPREGRYTDRYLKSVPFYFYVDVVSAVMVNIDRKMKCIHMKGGGVKFYDELVLTCGKQFQHPDYLHESLELGREVERGKPCDRILMDDPEYQPDRVPPQPEMPENLMLINSLYEANSCMRRLMRMISDEKDTPACLSEENPVVVFGECIEVYNCLTALLELGLVPKMLVFVESFPAEDALRVNCFNNETVDDRIQKSLEALGIRIIRQCSLGGWRQLDMRIEALHLMAPLHAMILPCFALFYYGLKAIDINAFRAINESGLVYDGGLIIGPTFETNDPHIYGAGPCTRYSRRLCAAKWPHHYYCSEDVGEALGRIFLHKLDPFVMCDPSADEASARYSSSLLGISSSHPSASAGSIGSASKVNLGPLSRRWQPVMKFESPIVQFSTLPGPVFYMTVRKPGPVIPMEVQLSLPRQGHTLITDKRGNYFRLQLNALHCVESVTCLSKKSFSPEILAQLYGKHEAFFNKLLARYKMGEIDDLYDFFTQPWMAALYQETFSELLRDINEQDVGTVYDLVKSRFSMAPSKSRSVNVAPHSTCATESACEMGYKDARNLGTFRSVIDKFVARTSTAELIRSQTQKPMDIPTECGQSAFVRSEAASFWKAVGGEKIVLAHIGRYLNRNSVTNPHYAKPKLDN